MRNSEQLSKIVYDNKLHVIRNALGTQLYFHAWAANSKQKMKFGSRVYSNLTPGSLSQNDQWLHELAHLKRKER